MYVGTFNNTENIRDKFFMVMNNNFKDLWGLPAQNDFPSIFPKH